MDALKLQLPCFRLSVSLPQVSYHRRALAGIVSFSGILLIHDHCFLLSGRHRQFRQAVSLQLRRMRGGGERPAYVVVMYRLPNS